ncbi:hypothetical protein PtrARCrB10_03736 [Pyrenophora tritici-repentis]|nr:hypothetical protein PtrARCrB10_03736 [Pyrenophora tritici-repentis]
MPLPTREYDDASRGERVLGSSVQTSGGGGSGGGGDETTTTTTEAGKGKNWGVLSLKGIVGRGSRWVSGGGGGGYWDRQGKEDKVFI